MSNVLMTSDQAIAMCDRALKGLVIAREAAKKKAIVHYRESNKEGSISRFLRRIGIRMHRVEDVDDETVWSRIEHGCDSHDIATAVAALTLRDEVRDFAKDFESRVLMLRDLTLVADHVNVSGEDVRAITSLTRLLRPDPVVGYRDWIK